MSHGADKVQIQPARLADSDSDLLPGALAPGPGPARGPTPGRVALSRQRRAAARVTVTADGGIAGPAAALAGPRPAAGPPAAGTEFGLHITSTSHRD